MRVQFDRSCQVARTPRVLQIEGMFDVPPAEVQTRSWDVDLPLHDRDWQIGLIVGPSGSGKSSLVSEAFLSRDTSHTETGPRWAPGVPVVDCFSPGLSVRDITGILSSVGFSSPPSWLQPYETLSTGEQFRVDVARTIIEAESLAVIDEFTSVVDRTVAQIGSAAIAKHLRTTNKQLVAATCHYDVIDWLTPDWIYDTATSTFRWECLLRPDIHVEVYRTTREPWRYFHRHHYLSSKLSTASQCWIGLIDEQPAVFTAVLAQPHVKSRLPIYRESRTVVTPDFQGVSIGVQFGEFIASLYTAAGYRYTSVTSHPAMIGHRAKSPLWTMTRTPGNAPAPSKTGAHMDGTLSCYVAMCDRGADIGIACLGDWPTPCNKHFDTPVCAYHLWLFLREKKYYFQWHC